MCDEPACRLPTLVWSRQLRSFLLSFTKSAQLIHSVSLIYSSTVLDAPCVYCSMLARKIVYYKASVLFLEFLYLLHDLHSGIIASRSCRTRHCHRLASAGGNRSRHFAARDRHAAATPGRRFHHLAGR